MSLEKTTVLDRFNHMQDELSKDLESIVNVEECNQMISFLEKNEHMLPPNVFYMLKLSENSIRKYQKDILQTINGAFGMTFTALKPALQSLFISKIL